MIPLLWLATAGTPSTDGSAAWGWPVLAGAAVLGLGGSALAAVALLRLFWQAGRTSRTGESWEEILRAAARPLPPASGLALLAAAYAPLPGLAGGVLLALAGALDRPGLWAAALVPPLILAAATWLLRRPPRDRHAAAPSGAAVRAGRAGAVGFATVLLLAVGVGASLLTVAHWARQIRSRAVPPAAVAFPAGTVLLYRSPVDPEITSLEAGRALHSVIGAGSAESGSPHLLPSAHPYAEPWLADDIERSVGYSLDLWSSRLLQDAAMGRLTQSAREALRPAAAHPAAPLFARAARSGAADLVSARLQLPVDPRTTALDVPLPDFVPLHHAAYAQVGSAALALDAGDPEAAERILRDVVGLGAVLHQEARTQADAAAGSAVVRIGLEGLASLLAAGGQEDQAVRIRADLQAAVASGTGPGAAWDALWRDTMAVCVDLPALLFGPPDGFGAWLESRARDLVRRPSDAAWFDLLVGRTCSPLPYM